MKSFLCHLLLFILFAVFATVAFNQTGALAVRNSRPSTAVIIGTPEAFTDGNGVFVRWQTIRETGVLGFQVYRIENGNRELVDNKFIPGASLSSRGQTLDGEQYSVFDPAGGSQSQYLVESVEVNGRHTSTGAVYAAFVPDLSKIAGSTSKDLVSSALQKNGYVATNGLLYTDEIQGEISSSLQSPDPINQRWVAAQPGAKIGVRQTGMYRVTRQQLQTAGFDVNSDPSLWQLYTDGVEQSITVEPNGNYFEFYGRSLDTLESDTRMYYLVVGPQAGRRIVMTRFRPSAGTVKAQNYDASVSVQERTTYLSSTLNGEETNFVGRLISSTGTTFNFNLTAVDTSSTTSEVTVQFFAFSATAHVMNLTLNGHPIGQLTGFGGSQDVSFDVIIPTSYLAQGNNILGMTTTASSDFLFFKSVQVNFKRRHVADQNRVSFTSQNYRGMKLENFTSPNVRVFDITYDGNPVQLNGAAITPDGGTYDVSIPAYRARVIYAVEDSALLSPASVSFNGPSALSTTNHQANLVIIAYKDFITQANAWADYRRAQGQLVEVVNVEDIFDEFNYGVLSADSQKDFLNFARGNWQTPPHFVLLMGDASYDPRNYEGRGFSDFVPSKIVDTIFTEAVSDDALVDFNNDGLAEMAIGRIPASTPDMITNALAKTTSFESTVATQNLSRGVLFTYDIPNTYDFPGMSQRMRDQLPVGTPAVMVDRNDANPNPVLITEQNNGRYLVNYSGHGSTGLWANSNNFRNTHVPLLTNINNLSVYTMLTCLNGYFAGTNVSMAEALLNSTTGGGVAVWASTGETTPDVQEVMGRRFYNQVGVGQITRLGDLIIDAKTTVFGGRDVRLSWVLIGDPMLKMR